MDDLRDNGPEGDHPLPEHVRVLAARIDELEAEVRASTAAGDPKKLKELAKVLDAWSKHDPKLEERVTKKVEGFGDRVHMLTQRLETLATTVATTASGLAGREGEIAALRRKVDEQNTVIQTSLEDLGVRVDSKPLLDVTETVRAMKGETGALNLNLQALAEDTTNRIEFLAQRLEALGSSVTAGVSALASRDQEIVELQAALRDSAARTDTTVARLVASEDGIASLSSALADQEKALTELRTLSDGMANQLESTVSELRRSVNTLASQLTRTDEFVSADMVRGLEDEIGRLGTRVEDSALRLDSLAADVKAVAERDAKSEAEVVALRGRLDDRDAHADLATEELRRSVGELSSRLSTLDDVASGETMRRLEAHVDSLRAEVESLGVRVGTLATTIEEARSGGEEKAAEVEVLSRRFDQARVRVEALIGDLREALDTMPTSTPPDPALVEGIDALSAQVVRLGSQLVDLEADTRGQMEDAASRAAELERLVAGAVSRLEAAQREQADGAVATSRMTAESAAELAHVTRRLRALEAWQKDSARAIDRVGVLPEDLTARLDAMDREQGTLAEEIVRVSDVVHGESSALRQELNTLQDAVSRSHETPAREVARISERLEEVRRHLSAHEAELTQVVESGASERQSVRHELDALAAAHAEAARAETDVVSRVEVLAARIDGISEESRSAAIELAHVSQLATVERSALRGQLEALAVTLTEQLSRRSDRAEALVTEVVDRVDAVERASTAAASEIERLSALHSSARETLDSPPGPDVGAEAVANESREAVLLELEHLASRIESRLRRLESGSAAAEQPEDVPSLVGDVVPIRGEA